MRDAERERDIENKAYIYLLSFSSVSQEYLNLSHNNTRWGLGATRRRTRTILEGEMARK